MDKKINYLVNFYCRLRDRQHAVYDRYAKQHGLTVNELFVLDILWFSPQGCTQKEICERLSVSKQTIAAITSRFYKKGYLRFEEVAKDKRNKRLFFTESGKAKAQAIIPPAALAENLAMARLGYEKAEALLHLTDAFTENMEKEFAEPKTEQPQEF